MTLGPFFSSLPASPRFVRALILGVVLGAFVCGGSAQGAVRRNPRGKLLGLIAVRGKVRGLRSAPVAPSSGGGNLLYNGGPVMRANTTRVPQMRRCGVWSRLPSDTSPCSAWVGRVDSKTTSRSASSRARSGGDRVGLPSVGRPKLAVQALDVLAKGTQVAQVTVERSQLIVQIPQRLTESISVIEVGCGLDVRDPL